MAAITLLDYGMCNMLNVARAFEHVGAQLTITEDPAQARSAERLIVPGVGAFSNSMHELNRRGHSDAIRDFVATGRPMLGICVGMQVLFEGSEEFGDTNGLGLLTGWVRAVPDQTVDCQPQRVPHIGWDKLLVPEQTNRSWAGTLLEPLAQIDPAVYFVHSFCAVPADKADILAECDYGGHRLCAAVARDNIVATQFHPERSGEIGLRALRHFVEM